MVLPFKQFLILLILAQIPVTPHGMKAVVTPQWDESHGYPSWDESHGYPSMG